MLPKQFFDDYIYYDSKKCDKIFQFEIKDDKYTIISNISRIQYSAQDYIYKIVMELGKYCKRIYIFGSVITDRYNLRKSDIDICIEVKDNMYKNYIYDIIQSICNYKCDCLFMDEIHSEKLLGKIKKGALVHEQID